MKAIAMDVITLHLERHREHASVGCPDDVGAHCSQDTVTEVQQVLWKSGSEKSKYVIDDVMGGMCTLDTANQGLKNHQLVTITRDMQDTWP